MAQALSVEIDALGVNLGPADGNIRLSGAGEADLPSTTRQLLQTHCVGDLPELRLPVLDAVQGPGKTRLSVRPWRSVGWLLLRLS